MVGVILKCLSSVLFFASLRYKYFYEDDEKAFKLMSVSCSALYFSIELG